MKQVRASQLAEWIANNTRGYAKRAGTRLYVEGRIDAYELLVYAESLLASELHTGFCSPEEVYYGQDKVEGCGTKG